MMPCPHRRRARLVPSVVLAVLAVSACAGSPAPGSAGSGAASADASPATWDRVVAEASGQTVDLWMYGGDRKGNAYVDEVLAPAAAELGVTLERVPVADTADALTRVLSELQAGRTEDGDVDLVWVNGENFRSGQEAGAWACGWTDELPHMRHTDPEDPLLTGDFGTPVQGCEAPWHKAQFVLAYDADDVDDVPATFEELLEWARAHPGRFTYPAPPDFTGSAFLRQALSTKLGADARTGELDRAAYDDVAPDLLGELAAVAPSLWREGTTYPRDLAQLEELYAGDQVDFTMTYGPATLEDLVREGVFPESTRVLPLDGSSLGNASFLAIPVNAGDPAGAKVIADLALSPAQQLAKARPEVWGQYTVLDLDRVPADVRREFAALPRTEVVPPFEELSRNALPELPAQWVASLEDDWRSAVLLGR